MSRSNDKMWVNDQANIAGVWEQAQLDAEVPTDVSFFALEGMWNVEIP
jgi:hypothetical protein